MRKFKADIILLQESNFKTNNISTLTKKDFPMVYNATNKLAKTKGVSITLSKHLPIEISDSLIDDEGLYIIIKGSVWGRPITIANIYSPNSAWLLSRHINDSSIFPIWHFHTRW